jgi:hypothetical protein
MSIDSSCSQSSSSPSRLATPFQSGSSGRRSQRDQLIRGQAVGCWHCVNPFVYIAASCRARSPSARSRAVAGHGPGGLQPCRGQFIPFSAASGQRRARPRQRVRWAASPSSICAATSPALIAALCSPISVPQQSNRIAARRYAAPISFNGSVSNRARLFPSNTSASHNRPKGGNAFRRGGAHSQIFTRSV